MLRRDSSCFLGFARNLNNISENQFDYVIEKTQKWSDDHPEPQKRELTEDEMNILKAYKALGYTYIAVDNIGYVCVYVNKPRRGERAWFARPGDFGTTAVCETKKFFGGIVSWEDEEPAKIEDLISNTDPDNRNRDAEKHRIRSENVLQERGQNNRYLSRKNG